MHILDRFSLLLLATIISTYSWGEDFKVLDYYNGINISELPCKMALTDKGEYMCSFGNSETDVFEFQSDPIGKEVFRLHRYILLKKSDAQKVAKQLVQKFGKPNSVFYDKDFNPPVPVMAWGDSQLDIITKYDVFIINQKKGGVGLSSKFLSCKYSFGQCNKLFGVSGSSNEIVLSLMIFDVDRRDYSETVLRTGKHPQPKNAIKTQDATKLEY